MMQKRRTFIKTAAVLGVGLPFLGCSSEMKESIMKSKYVNNIGLQLWTVRDQLNKDFEGTLKKIAAHGYQQIEATGLDQATQALPIAKDLGMKINSTHIPSAYFTERWEFAGNEPKAFERLLEEAVEKGISHLVVAWLNDGERGADDYKKLIENMNKYGEQTTKAGISLNYHNHNFEFKKLEGEVVYDKLIKGFDPKYVNFELDVFWASVANFDPIELMKRLKGRVKLLHLKDKLKDQPVVFEVGDVPNEAYKELGNGVVDIKTVVEMAEATGVDHCFVEQDQSPDPIASTKTSIDWLNQTF